MFSLILVGKICVFYFSLENGDHPKLVVDFLRENIFR